MSFENRVSERFARRHPDIVAALTSDDYSFLGTNERLGDRIALLGLGGSHAYGTNVEGSDIDIRGIALNSRSDLLGLSQFDTFVNTETDTTVYSVNKFFRLLMDCNPNIVEFLGLEPDDYAVVTPIGQRILGCRDLFLSQRVYHSFGGYAYAQLKRFQNATARDSLSDEEREKHILHSVERQLANIQKDFGEIAGSGTIRLHIDDAVTEGHTKEILMDGSFSGYSLRAFNAMYSAMNQVCKDYDRIDHRNRKKDDAHLNKHAMHLIRLYQMAIEILSGDGLHTRRTGSDLALLMDIRGGAYMKDGVMTPGFYALVDAYQKKLQDAYDSTALPKYPDTKAVEELLMEINEAALH